jgi:hypothetical protein
VLLLAQPLLAQDATECLDVQCHLLALHEGHCILLRAHNGCTTAATVVVIWSSAGAVLLMHKSLTALTLQQGMQVDRAAHLVHLLQCLLHV